MKQLFYIFDLILIRFVTFSLTFFLSLSFVSILIKPSTHQKTESSLLNLEIYKRPNNFNCFPIKPIPLVLVIKLSDQNRLTLNGEEFEFQDTSELEERLVQVFKVRENEGVFFNEGNITEKSILIIFDHKTKFGNLEKISDALKRAGATSIYIDPLNELSQCLLGGGGSGSK